MNVVSVVVPVYRNASTLFELYHRVIDIFNRIKDKKLELYFVNDGSDDESLELIQKLSEQDSSVHYLSFNRNYGQVAAIIAGLRNCSGDAAIVISADLQDPPEMILEMIRSWERGSVITICNRKSRNDRFIDKLFSVIFYGTMQLIYPLIPRGGFDFFLLDKSALIVFNSIYKRGRFIQGDVVKLKLPIVFLPYERLSRKVGKSQWTFKRKLLYSFDALSYSQCLLSVFSALGFIMVFSEIFMLASKDIPSFIGGLVLLTGFILLGIGLWGFVYRLFNYHKRQNELYIIESRSYG